MAPVRSYTNWNSRTTDNEVQIEPYRKYFFICETLKPVILKSLLIFENR